MRDMKLKLNPTYCITPTYITEGKGRKKKSKLDSISYKFSFNRGIIVNGVVTKKDAKETLTFLDSVNINFYEALLNTIMSEIVRMANDLVEENLTRDDFKDFYENNIDTFNAFISELKQYAEEMAQDELTALKTILNGGTEEQQPPFAFS